MSPLLSRVSNTQGVNSLSGFRRAFLGRPSGAGAGGYSIPRSLRFNSSDSAYLSGGFFQNVDTQTYTISVWVKRSKIGTLQRIYSTNANSYIMFDTTDKLHGNLRGTTGTNSFWYTNAVFRDVGAWYHIVAVWDTSNPTQADRLKLYVNGVEQTFTSTSFPDYAQHSGGTHTIGGTYYPDCYLADFHYVGGLALPASAFGETDAYGVWQPKTIDSAPNDGTVWSTYLTSDDGNFDVSYPKTNAFDNSESTRALTNTAVVNTSYIQFNSPVPLTGNLRVRCDNGNAIYDVTGGGSTLLGTNSSGADNQRVNCGDVTNLTSLKILMTGGSRPGISKITLDGVTLIDGFNQFTNGTFYSNVTSYNNVDAGSVTNLFDGNTGTTFEANSSGGNIVFTPLTGIPYTTSVEVYTARATAQGVSLNGGTQVSTTSGWNTIDSGSGTLNTLTFYNGSAGNQSFAAIRVDGTILTDATVGRNSFHLKFDDASSKDTLGTDSANGNDWTVTNIIVASNDYATTFTGTERSGFEWTRVFDGDLNQGSVPDANTTWTWTPSTSIPFTTLAVYAYKDSTPGGLEINGTSVISQIPNHNGIGPNQRTVITGISSPLTSIKSISTGSLANVVVAGIEIDGTVLIAGDPEDIDSLLDSPTNGDPSVDTGLGGQLSGNYATLSPLVSGSNVTLSNGNLRGVSGGLGGGTARSAFSTIAVDVSQKWYCEVLVGSTNVLVGIIKADNYDLTKYPGETAAGYGYYDNGQKYNNGSGTAYGATFTTGDLLGIAIDNGTLTFYKNGTSQGAAFTGLSGQFLIGFGSYNNTVDFNFGQRPFAYTAPSGYKALCTANLPTPTIADGSTAMDVVTWSGDNTNPRSITTGFGPDLVWIKARNQGYYNTLYDSVRTATARALSSNTTDKENGPTNNWDTSNGYLSSFDTTGFTLTGGSTANYWTNRSGVTYAAWCWDAGSSTVSNTDGSITSSVRANPSAGFSIVSYTGNNLASGTIGHGLGAKPSLIFVKRTGTGGNDWGVYHTSLGATKNIDLNNSSSSSTTNGVWNDTEPTTSVFTVGTFDMVNASDTYIAYCFAPVEGYSAVGKWTGGSDAFVYLGFRPKWLLVKANAASHEWLIFDSERSTYNQIDDWLTADTAAVEVTSNATNYLDFLSNGFKIKGTGGYFGTSADMLYMAFAEHPFKSSRAR